MRFALVSGLLLLVAACGADTTRQIDQLGTFSVEIPNDWGVHREIDGSTEGQESFLFATSRSLTKVGYNFAGIALPNDPDKTLRQWADSVWLRVHHNVGKIIDPVHSEGTVAGHQAHIIEFRMLDKAVYYRAKVAFFREGNTGYVLVNEYREGDDDFYDDVEEIWETFKIEGELPPLEESWDDS